MNGDFEEARESVVEKVDEAVDSHTGNPTEQIALKTEIHNLLDIFEGAVYKSAMEDFFEAADFDFIRHEVAMRYGVDVSEVTPEFLKEKIQAHESEKIKSLEKYENDCGVHLRKDTPEIRAFVESEFKKIFG